MNLSEKKARKKPADSATRSTTSRGDAGPMDVGLLKQLVELMAKNDLNTVDLRDGEQRVVLKRGAENVAAGAIPATYAPAMQSAVQTTGAGAALPALAVDDEAGLIPIKSPMVGTFYAAPSPDSKPFVQVGSSVAKDETDICMIEAMKTYNTLKADVTGTIAKVLVQNGQSVDVNKVLFLVKPA